MTVATTTPDSAATATPLREKAAPRFHLLTIGEVRRETPDAVSLIFDVPPELGPDYAFAPGQYLTLRTLIDGEDVRRSYSICSAPSDGELRVAVKRIDNGLFSSWVHQELTAGDKLEVMTPTGRFGQIAPAEGGRVFVGFAAGSGITPLLSILRHTLATEKDSRFFLFYGSRSVDEMMFRPELEELKDRYLGRLSVFHVLSREAQDVSILNGHIDAEKVRLLLTKMLPAAAIDHAFICGPAAMIDNVEGALRELDVAPEKIHVERFVSAQGGRPRPAPVIAPEAPSAHVISLIVDGKRREIPAAEGEAILDAALRAGVDLPFACKGGMCSTCRAKIVEGTATMDVNFSLEPWELDSGFVLTCQARPTSARVTVDFDHM